MTTQPLLSVRPVRPADADAMRAFVQALDAGARRMRFHAAISDCSAALLRQLTQADGVRHVAYVATDAAGRIVGEARYAVGDDGSAADFAISVAATARGSGLAAALLQQLQAAAAAAGVRRLHGDVLCDNARMAAFLRRAGFEPLLDDAALDPGALRWQRDLSPAAAPRVALAWLQQAARHAHAACAPAAWRAWLQRAVAALAPRGVPALRR